MKLGQAFWAFAAAVRAVPLEKRHDFPGLYFKDGKFEITVFNDLHLGDRGWQVGDPRVKGGWSDDATMGVVNQVLDWEPTTDLAVLNGDLMSCEWLGGSLIYDLLNKAMAPFLSRKLPFTATFGNHDRSPTCDTREMAKHIWNTANKDGRQLTFTLSSEMADDIPDKVGATNYFIPIYSKVGNSQKLKLILWFFDSKGGLLFTGNPDDRRPSESWVHQNVIDWFKKNRDELERDHGGKTIPSLAFVHIPLPITEWLWKYKARSQTQEPGIKIEDPGTQGLDEDNHASALPFMKALVETKGLLGIFSGHDHGIDACSRWKKTPGGTKLTKLGVPSNGDGLTLCLGGHTGYGGYGIHMRGGRHIVINETALQEDNSIETWNRLEDGSVTAKVMLNSTYGEDKYAIEKVKYNAFGAPDRFVADRADYGAKKTSSQPQTTKSKKGCKPTSTAETSPVSKYVTQTKSGRSGGRSTTTSSKTKPEPSPTGKPPHKRKCHSHDKGLH